MKLTNDESKCPNNENELPIINIKIATFKIHDREVKGDSFPNPFSIPAFKRIFGNSENEITRKVKPIPFIMSEPQTICNIDENFFKVIEGRPIRRFEDIKVYIRNLRDIVLSKANAAYLKDKILLVNALNEYELHEYTKIVNHYAETKTNFVRFARNSFNIAKELESMAELMASRIAKITDELDGYCFEYIKMKNQVLSIMYTFEVLMTYGKFLHLISPATWRIEFDNLNRNIEFSDNKQQDSQLVLLTTMASLDEFKDKAAKYSTMPTRIYFREPKQVIELFENISEQCRNYMSINVNSTKLVKSCIKCRDSLKIAVKEDEDLMQDEIVAMKADLAYMEGRELEYKSAFEKLLHHSFYELYAGRENVKLFNCVQYVTTRIFGDFDDPKDTVSTLMRRIELEYMDLSLAMDYLDLATVKNATKQIYARDQIVMKQAHFAQRTLKECDIFKKCLVVSFEPSRSRNFQKLGAKKFKDANNVTEVLNLCRKVRKV